VNNITDVFGYSKMCDCWAPRSVTEYNRIVREKVFFQIFSPTRLMMKVICRGSSLGMNDESVALKRRQKRQPVEWHHATSSRSYPFSRESPWPLDFL